MNNMELFSANPKKKFDTGYSLSDSCIGTFRPCISPKHYQVDDNYAYQWVTKSTKYSSQ